MTIGDYGKVDRAHRSRVTKRYRDRVGVVVGYDTEGGICTLCMRKKAGARGVYELSLPAKNVEIVERAPRDEAGMGLTQALTHALELEATGT